MATTLTQQQVLMDPEVGPYLIGLMESAKKQGTLSKDVVIPDYKFADFTPKQKQAFEMAQQGIGSYEQFFDKTGNMYDQAAQQFSQLPQFGGKAVEAVTAGKAAAQPLMGTAAEKYGNISDIAGKGVSTTAAGAAAAQPLLTSAAEQYGNLSSYGSEAQRLAAAGAAGFDPASVSQYMDPYQKQVISNAMDEMRRQSDISQQAAAAQAVRAGAFGGSRFGVQQAELARNLAQAQNQKIAELMSQGYTQAQATALTAFENEQRRKQMEASTALSAGELAGKGAQGIASLAGETADIAKGVGATQLAAAQAEATAAGGIESLAGKEFGMGKDISNTQLAAGELAGKGAQGIASLGEAEQNLGKAQQAAGQADVSFLANIGAQERADEQARLDAARTLELQKQNQPWDILQKVSDIYKGVPSGSTTTGSTTTQAPSTASQILGNTMSIYGALNQANNPTTSGYSGYK